MMNNKKNMIEWSALNHSIGLSSRGLASCNHYIKRSPMYFAAVLSLNNMKISTGGFKQDDADKIQRSIDKLINDNADMIIKIENKQIALIIINCAKKSELTGELKKFKEDNNSSSDIYIFDIIYDKLLSLTEFRGPIKGKEEFITFEILTKEENIGIKHIETFKEVLQRIFEMYKNPQFLKDHDDAGDIADLSLDEIKESVVKRIADILGYSRRLKNIFFNVFDEDRLKVKESKTSPYDIKIDDYALRIKFTKKVQLQLSDSEHEKNLIEKDIDNIDFISGAVYKERWEKFKESVFEAFKSHVNYVYDSHLVTSYYKEKTFYTVGGVTTVAAATSATLLCFTPFVLAGLVSAGITTGGLGGTVVMKRHNDNEYKKIKAQKEEFDKKPVASSVDSFVAEAKKLSDDIEKSNNSVSSAEEGPREEKNSCDDEKTSDDEKPIVIDTIDNEGGKEQLIINYHYVSSKGKEDIKNDFFKLANTFIPSLGISVDCEKISSKYSKEVETMVNDFVALKSSAICFQRGTYTPNPNKINNNTRSLQKI